MFAEQYILAVGGVPINENVELVSLDPLRPVPSCLQDLPILPEGARYLAGAATLLPGDVLRQPNV